MKPRTAADVRRAWRSLIRETRQALAETVIWWGYLLLPESPERDALVVFLADWLTSCARRRDDL
jgi:hypothetical protein